MADSSNIVLILDNIKWLNRIYIINIIREIK